jgi:hypothetical protein
MEISPIFLSLIIFMFLTSFTLTGLVIRQKKSNRMLGEIAAQSKVENAHRYSRLGIGLRNQEYVSKCPACAEWMYLLANVCATCQHNVESHNLNLERAMREIDAGISAAEEARLASRKAKRVSNKNRRSIFFKSPLFRTSLGSIFAIVIISVGLQAQSTYTSNKATSLPSSPSELKRSWNSIITECQFSTVTEQSIQAIESDDKAVSVVIKLPWTLGTFPDWSSPTGQAIVCFSKKALAIDVSKEFINANENRISLRNFYLVEISFYNSYSFQTDKRTQNARVEFSWGSRI